MTKKLHDEKCGATAQDKNAFPNGGAHERLLWDGAGAAQRLNISIQLLRKLVRQQRLKRVPGVRKLLIPESSLVGFAASAE
jgi:hypothetical protein